MKKLIFKDGTKIPIKEDGGKYWITENARFRKNNPAITGVEETAREEDEKKLTKSQARRKKTQEEDNSAGKEE